jgi:hypothetical protein
MKKTELLQGIKKMRFNEIYGDWESGKLDQIEAARILGVSDRTFRRYLVRYERDGLEGLIDYRIEKSSHLRAPVDEVMGLLDHYRGHYLGWNVKHYFNVYKKTGERSYTWVKNELQAAKLVEKQPSKGKHRKRRERSAMEGMMIHQDGSTHEWVPGVHWDLIVTMDDATNEHYSMFFADEEGTVSSMQGVQEVIEKKGLFCSFYSDRGSHYWTTPEAGGKVDKVNLTQFGCAMKRLGIEMIAAYSPEARGRSERMFRTHQDRLVKELALANISDMESANRYLQEIYLPEFNLEFKVKSLAEGSAFVPHFGVELKDILCEEFERTVGKDNCISFEKLILQIQQDTYRMNYVKTKVKVRRHLDSTLSVFHGPRKLASYDYKGKLTNPIEISVKKEDVARINFEHLARSAQAECVI